MLSLAGVTVGIFVIITVLTVVDSLEKGLKDSFTFLGANVVYVAKWPFGGGGEYKWWEYISRPRATYDEFQFLERNLNHAEGICIFAIGNAMVKHENSNVPDISIFGTTYGYVDVFDFSLSSGRYFSVQEVDKASNVAIIGARVKGQLFPNESPVGKEIDIRGLNFNVIGVFEEEGESLLDTPSDDELVLIPYNALRKIYYTGKYKGLESTIGLKGSTEDQDLQLLQNEVTGLMRAKRGLKPREENNFALNRPEAIANEIGKIFSVLKLVGFVIGLFSILIGGFGIANIMFVSVKERTGIIGIQKSLGAKNYFILLQFLFEAIYLSLLGGVAGLILVYLVTFIPVGKLELALNLGNTLMGVGIVTLVGVASGIIPAMVASRLNPVIAIRSN